MRAGNNFLTGNFPCNICPFRKCRISDLLEKVNKYTQFYLRLVNRINILTTVTHLVSIYTAPQRELITSFIFMSCVFTSCIFSPPHTGSE